MIPIVRQSLISVFSTGIKVAAFFALVCLIGFLLVGCDINPEVDVKNVDIPIDAIAEAIEDLGCVVEDIDGFPFIQCGSQDPVAIPIVPGPRGEDGTNGTNGSDGSDGTDGNNGVDGRDGVDGIDGISPILEVIDPCGQEGDFDEVIFRLSVETCRDIDDCTDLYGVYSHGSRVHETGIFPGIYNTTDGTGCVFEVTEDLDVIW